MGTKNNYTNLCNTTKNKFMIESKTTSKKDVSKINDFAIVRVSNILKAEVTKEILEASQSKKKHFDYIDAAKLFSIGSPRAKAIIEATSYLDTNPLKDNDYFKYVNAFIKDGVKLNTKYFRHDINKLNHYYEVAEKNEGRNPFSLEAYENYVYFMFLKLRGVYSGGDNKLFNVKIIDSREYNPLSKIPSVLRGCLPFDVKEYDIKRAFPTFIDIELKTDYRNTAYEILDKKEFAMFLNANIESKISYANAIKGLTRLYNDKAIDVLTIDRYNERGRIFKDLTRYEKDYIDKFIKLNNLKNYVRLHDGVFVLNSERCEVLRIDLVEFGIKESIKPEIINNTKSFYSFNDSKAVHTSPSMYADFLIQEKFVRVSTSRDAIQLLKNTNNVVDFFNHKTDMVSLLENEINEASEEKLQVRNKLANDNNSVLANSYTLIPPIKLTYYKDPKKSFGLPFSNGFFYFDNVNELSIKSKDYISVNGFFAPHKSQQRQFKYTDVQGNFETFVQRIATGKKNLSEYTSEDIELVECYNSMIGYLVHNYKPTESPCVILTDEGATGEQRNGRRGKSLIYTALEEVTKTMVKGSIEFDPSYLFNYADLDKSYNLYVIDDVPRGFDYVSLYTQITGGINSQKKGYKAEMIEREDTPKFLITSNFVFRCDEKDASTVARFYEYKIKPYYNAEFTPRHEFKQSFFEDWDNEEWNKFYSYIFRCARHYLMNGIQRIKYDKTEDNFNASFGSDIRLSEMERIINLIVNHKHQNSFSASEFLEIYNQYDNSLKQEKLFNSNNTKKYIDLYLSMYNSHHFEYVLRYRRWFKK